MKRIWVGCLMAIAAVVVVYHASSSSPVELLPQSAMVWGPPSLMPRSMQHPRLVHRKAQDSHGMVLNLNQANNKGSITFNFELPSSDGDLKADSSKPHLTKPSHHLANPPGSHTGAKAVLQSGAVPPGPRSTVLLYRPWKSSASVLSTTPVGHAKLSVETKAPSVLHEAAAQKHTELARQEKRVDVLGKLTALSEAITGEKPSFDEDLAPMSELAERARLVRAELIDARKSVVTEVGVKRVHKLEEELYDVQNELRKLPEMLPEKIQLAEHEISEARLLVEKLREQVFREENKISNLKGLETKADKLAQQELNLESRVELKREEQSVLADLTGQNSADSPPLPHDTTDESITTGLSLTPKLNELKEKLSQLKQELKEAEEHLADLERDKDDLIANLREVHRAHVSPQDAIAEHDIEWQIAAARPTAAKTGEAPPAATATNPAIVPATETTASKSPIPLATIPHAAFPPKKDAAMRMPDDNVDPTKPYTIQTAHGGRGVRVPVQALKAFVADGGKIYRGGVRSFDAEKQQEIKTPDYANTVVGPDAEPKEEDGADAVAAVANSTDSGEEEMPEEKANKPSAQWCQWGTQMMPCAPGYGGGWYEKGRRYDDTGIWPKDGLINFNFNDNEDRNVYAGKRSHSYLQDMFTYGKGGIFGAKQERHNLGLRRASMLAGGRQNESPLHRAAYKEHLSKVQPVVESGWFQGGAERAGAVARASAELTDPVLIEKIMRGKRVADSARYSPTQQGSNRDLDMASLEQLRKAQLARFNAIAKSVSFL